MHKLEESMQTPHSFFSTSKQNTFCEDLLYFFLPALNQGWSPARNGLLGSAGSPLASPEVALNSLAGT